MTQAGPLRWRTGAGWLVLIGGGNWETTEPIDRNAIEAMTDEAPIAFVPAAGGSPDSGESFLEHYTRLGAPPGYVAPIYDATSANDPVNARRLVQAGLIYLGGGDTRQLLDALTGTPALDAIAAAYASGAIVVGMSAGAMALCAWGVALDPAVGVLQGWGWLPHVIAAPHYTPERSTALREALLQHPQLLGLGLPDDTALALGPDGEVLTWGSGQITVTLGPKFDPEG
ncbi:MAG TPA: Type 1 glutamine amidotransferase-like domain-containing protein [Anaerolineae bacterium]|nr:Type 1 glutamine amidotransferase-like domain-containing protein [Anaerolineae bacterium]